MKAPAVGLVIVAYLCSGVIGESVPFTNCARGGRSVFTVKNFDVSPLPLRSGKDVTIEVTFDSADVVTSGTVIIEVSGRGRLSFIDRSFSVDLCANSPVGCPIRKGKTSFTVTRTLPSIPSSLQGLYDFKISATDNQGRELICSRVEVTLKSQSKLLEKLLRLLRI